MLCLLPSTALALSGFDPADVPNASGLFNLMRNLGGAIGLALIDTVLEQRTPAHIASIVAPAGGRSVGGPSGWPADRALHRRADRRGALVAPLVERAGFVAAFNDAWLLTLIFLVSRAPVRQKNLRKTSRRRSAAPRPWLYLASVQLLARRLARPEYH
jgi:MFS transporter, DHA2 family, multidrug resistance protein